MTNHSEELTVEFVNAINDVGILGMDDKNNELIKVWKNKSLKSLRDTLNENCVDFTIGLLVYIQKRGFDNRCINRYKCTKNHTD